MPVFAVSVELARVAALILCDDTRMFLSSMHLCDV
jgi:hypothetical protein